MLPEINYDECLEIAREYDFTGGQIENVARKCKIEYVVSGKIPTLSQVKDFCKDEYLNRNHGSRIGFQKKSGELRSEECKWCRH